MNPQNTDNSTVFDTLWAILGELHQKLGDRFELYLEPASQSLQQFSSPDGRVQGSLRAFSGAEIDWLVHSHLKNPMLNFSTMRLKVVLKGQVLKHTIMIKIL
ncbi:hypothetical protein MC7420_4899 [Coleofasciculus chthonoplastes PCC 7420]|uniref:Uncharacterized protein n=1 Tax=Coleofasciculus chthonoplastes PCC 7420 TaxID=118168 RepID=B4VNP5_9CYAN|nr:hypothetical protein [Coleofasciculus chthonoplastes]EDX76643.1 hypothetical protein MC7420_4899 [Coleofasciculus chthonoplastes PCC 7420]